MLYRFLWVIGYPQRKQLVFSPQSSNTEIGVHLTEAAEASEVYLLCSREASSRTVLAKPLEIIPIPLTAVTALSFVIINKLSEW